MSGEDHGAIGSGELTLGRRVLPSPPILVISDRKQAAIPLAEIASALFAAGCRWFSLREKDLPEDALAREARVLKPLAEAAGARLALHGTASLARSLGLDALHLPGGSDVAEARARMGQGALIGLSLHAGEKLSLAEKAAIDYATFSPIFLSASKRGYGPEIGLPGLQAATQGNDLQLLALGGIETPAGAQACQAAGASGIAVMGAFMRSPDPGRTFRKFLEAWEVRR